jgi:hypothetical protein
MIANADGSNLLSISLVANCGFDYSLPMNVTSSTGEQDIEEGDISNECNGFPITYKFDITTNPDSSQTWTATWLNPQCIFSDSSGSATVTVPKPPPNAFNTSQYSIWLDSDMPCDQLWPGPLQFTDVQMTRSNGTAITDSFFTVQSSDPVCEESVSVDNAQRSINLEWSTNPANGR